MRCALAVLAGLLITGPGTAQTSPSYGLEEFVFNSGGHPEAGTILTSTSYRVTLDALGENVSGRGLSSASYRMDSSFHSAYPPPREVTGLRFTNNATLVWDPEESIGVYNLYRDWLSNLSGLGYGQCRQYDLPGETATETGTSIPPGSGFFYLVTAENRLGEEGTKGVDSSYIERPNPSPCP